MVIAFTGDPFLAREALLEEARLRGLSRFTEPTPEALAQALAPGLFGGGGAMLDLREVGEAEWKALKPLLESVPEGVPVLLLDPKPSPSRAAFYRNRERRDFPTPKGKDLVRHLENRAKRLGLRLPGGVAQYLASLEGDARPWSGSWRKLALSPPLTLEKVEKVVALRPPSRALTWCAPSWRRTPRRPSCASGASRRRGGAPQAPRGPLLAVRPPRPGLLPPPGKPQAQGGGPRPPEAHPYAARRALEAAKRLTEEALKEALDALMEAEKRAKGGKTRGSPWRRRSSASPVDPRVSPG